MSPYGAVGIPLELGGTALNVYGQRRGLDAMRDVWGNAGREQAGYNQQLQDATNTYLSGLTPQSMTGADTAGQNLATAIGALNSGTKAAKTIAKRKGGNVEGKAAAAQSRQGIRSPLIDQARIQAIIAGLRAGANNTDMLGRQFSLDRGIITRNARDAQSLVPLYENAASHTGSAYRQGGDLMRMFGQGAMSYGMSQPMSAPVAYDPYQGTI